MRISRVTIKNFKCFQGDFTLELKDGINILVGDNEVGKSTVLEALHLALSGLINGRFIKLELSQYLFNNSVCEEYIKAISESNDSTGAPFPPEILIEIHFDSEHDSSIKAEFEGNRNLEKVSSCGFQFRICLDEGYKPLYEEYVKEGNMTSIPIEYYHFYWETFARDKITPRKIPARAMFIDSSNTKFQNGSDVYISRILKDFLTDEQRIKVDQAHRKLRDNFQHDEAIAGLNNLLNNRINISKKEVELSVDLSTRNAWESTLTTYIDKVPFHHIGKGEQCLVKTKLALCNEKSQQANIILLEEPENHLSHSRLHELIEYIHEKNKEKQVLVSTHSSFVANKLGLENLVLLNCPTSGKRQKVKFEELESSTKEYFRRLAGYDTLRLVLCKKAILVEGDSDELIVQRAYMDNYSGNLPIQDGVDVISVGTSFLRFLEIASVLEKPVCVVTDNDGDVEALKKKYEDYLDLHCHFKNVL